jgi:hypothetical protein
MAEIPEFDEAKLTLPGPDGKWREKVQLPAKDVVIAYEEQHADPIELEAEFSDGLYVTFRAITAEDLMALIREFDDQFNTTIEGRLDGARYER